MQAALSMQSTRYVANLLSQENIRLRQCNARQGDWTPLMAAAAHAHASVIEILLDHGADPTARDFVSAFFGM